MFYGVFPARLLFVMVFAQQLTELEFRFVPLDIARPQSADCHRLRAPVDVVDL